MKFGSFKLLAVGVISGFLIASGAASAVAAKKSTAPKIGECYLLTTSQLFSLNSGKKPVSCSNEHSAETYRVTKWPTNPDANSLTEVERRGTVEPLCQPEKVIGTDFSNWSYKIPTSAQWKAGARWIRCDAFSVSPEDPSVVITYKGKKLKTK